MMKPWGTLQNTARGIKLFSTIVSRTYDNGCSLGALTQCNTVLAKSQFVRKSSLQSVPGSNSATRSEIRHDAAFKRTYMTANILRRYQDNASGLSKNLVLKNFTRGYAKGRERTTNKKKSVVKINEEAMAELIDVEAYKTGLEELNENLREEFRKQLNVRGAAGALETLEVDFEGESYPLQELAQVGRKNPQLVVLNLASLPDALQPVLKAIEASGMNLNPQQEGTTIYLAIPKVTREHRENMARNAKTLFTKYKGLFQTLQNRYIKQCRSNKEGTSEDLVFEVQQQIMKLASDYVHQAEELCKLKQKELLQQE